MRVEVNSNPDTRFLVEYGRQDSTRILQLMYPTYYREL
jgi:hypothetical protein